MSDFHNNIPVKACRKACHCEQCGQTIEAGKPKIHSSGRYEGGFYSMDQHVECFDAACAYAKENDLYGEDWPWFRDGIFYSEDHEWMVENHPLVADRLGWKVEVDA